MSVDDKALIGVQTRMNLKETLFHGRGIRMYLLHDFSELVDTSVIFSQQLSIGKGFSEDPYFYFGLFVVKKAHAYGIFIFNLQISGHHSTEDLMIFVPTCLKLYILNHITVTVTNRLKDIGITCEEINEYIKEKFTLEMKKEAEKYSNLIKMRDELYASIA